MGRVLLDRGHLLSRRFVPKFELVRTQANDRFLPDFYPSQLFETPPARARLTDISFCIRQGSRVK